MGLDLKAIDEQILAALDEWLEAQGVDRELAARKRRSKARDVEREKALVSTRKLADLTGLDRDLVYRRLKAMEGVHSDLYVGKRRSERVLTWFPLTGTVVTKKNHERVTKLASELKTVVDDTPLSNRKEYTFDDKQLLKAAFDRKLGETRAKLPGEHGERIDEYRDRLFATIDGSNDPKVKRAAGVGGFHPWECVWSRYEVPERGPHPPDVTTRR